MDHVRRVSAWALPLLLVLPLSLRAAVPSAMEQCAAGLEAFPSFICDGNASPFCADFPAEGKVKALYDCPAPYNIDNAVAGEFPYAGCHPGPGEPLIYSADTSSDDNGMCSGGMPEECDLPEGTETARGINASGIQPGAIGCDRESNCQTVFESTDFISLQGNSFRGGRFVTNGETCETEDDDHDDEDVEDVVCRPMGNLEVCVSEDEICATAPSGTRYCWPNTPPTDDACSSTETDAVCADDSPPAAPPPRVDGRDDWQEDSGGSVTRNGDTTYINSYTNTEDTDSDDDGTEDEDDDDEGTRTASITGCSAEPSCDGDAIDCAQLRYLWRISCVNHGDTTSGGAECSAPPTCSTDQNVIECAQLNQLWRIRCDSDQKWQGGTNCKVPPSAKGPPLLVAAAQQQWEIACAMKTTGGGTSCANPPQCKDDSVMCGVLKEAHRSRCRAEGVEAALSGSCEAPPTCTGDELGCSMMRLSWQQACASEGIADALGEDVDPADEGDEPALAGVVQSRQVGAPQTGGGGAGTCPVIELPEVLGVSLGTVSAHCSLWELSGWFILALGAFISYRIMVE